MTSKFGIRVLGNSRPAFFGRKLAGVALAAWFAILIAPVANASEPARNTDGVADRLNQQQLASTAVPMANSPTMPAASNEIGVLVLRNDGGDPQLIRPDDQYNLVYIARRDGDGRAYRNGREVEINAAIKESAQQIAAAQFVTARSGEVPLSRLPTAAQIAVAQLDRSNPPRIAFAHLTSRKDTGWVSDKRAAKILALEASANNNRDIVALVKMAMQMFGLKSDACDNSPDARCNEPGVREAFAQIKREEALQRTAPRF